MACGMCSQGLPLMSGGGKPKKSSKKVTNPKPKHSSKQFNQKKGGGNVLANSGVANSISWHKTGSIGNYCLNLFLSQNQRVIADGNAMLYMDGAIKYETEMGSAKKAIGRVLSGEKAFMSWYTGTNSNKKQRITLGIPLPGDVMMIPIKANETWKLSSGSFLAGTHNISVSGKLNMKGLFSIGQQEGFVLSTVTAKETDGFIWVASYGHIEKHDIKEGDTLLIDNEHFLACPKGVDYDLVKVDNMKTLVFGGEGLAMKFKGPCTVYTQSKGVYALARVLYQYLPKSDK